MISFSPIKIEDSKWLNVVHTNNSSRTQKEENCVEIDMKVEMANILKEENWDSIVLLANNGSDLLSIAELGLLLIKEIDKLVQLGEWNKAIVWFLTEKNAQITDRQLVYGQWLEQHVLKCQT